MGSCREEVNNARPGERRIANNAGSAPRGGKDA
jgi:hypothetical protein